MRIVCSFAFALGLAHAQSYSFVQFDFPGSAGTAALRINNSGQILGRYTDSSNSTHCFLRSRDGATYTTVADPPGAIPGSSTCSGLNNLGQVVGSFQDAQGFHCYIRSATGSFSTFNLPTSPGPGADAADINDDGEIVGPVALPPYSGTGFLRNADGGFITLEATVGLIAPAALNNLGEVAGWLLNGSSQGTQHGFLRSPGGVYTKFDLPGTTSYTRISALNTVGQFAGFMIGGPGFVSNRDGSFALLDGYPVAGINDTGELVGTRFDGKTTHGFIGTPSPGSTQPAIRTVLPGVLTAAAFGGAWTIAPGIWIEIYGQNLAPTTRQWRASDFQGDAAPTSLDGVGVTISGVRAFVSYISPGQVNALVPSTVVPGTAQVTVTNAGQTTAPRTVTVNASQPAMLSLPPDFDPGGAYVAALFPDFTTYVLPPFHSNVPVRRPKAGDTIILFGTGFGPVVPDVPVGSIANQPASLIASFQITFSRAAPPVPGKVTYAGLVPGTVGLYQFNVVLPDVPLFPGETFDDYIGVNVTVDGVPALGRQRLYLSMSR